MAIIALNDLRQRDKLPILTIGTGLYMRALFDGLADLPQRSEELRTRLRASIEKHGDTYLHRVLQRLDPQSAQRIAPADTQKLLRAVEVCLLTRRPLTAVHNQGRTPLTGWRILKIGLQPPREELYARIHTRIDNMLTQGWQAEVRRLLAASSSENAKPFDFLGYRELAAVARNEMSLQAARATIQQSTRRYAKRQQTWFRREQNVQWFNGFGDDPQFQAEIRQWLKRCSSESSDPCL
jgi:tRNA dimethylallyltransferase